jgi:hypothetical protein
MKGVWMSARNGWFLLLVITSIGWLRAGTITGVVTDQRDDPVTDATVFAEDAQGNIYSDITDENGQYLIVVPVEGYYRVTLSRSLQSRTTWPEKGYYLEWIGSDTYLFDFGIQTTGVVVDFGGPRKGENTQKDLTHWQDYFLYEVLYIDAPPAVFQLDLIVTGCDSETGWIVTGSWRDPMDIVRKVEPIQAVPIDGQPFTHIGCSLILSNGTHITVKTPATAFQDGSIATITFHIYDDDFDFGQQGSARLKFDYWAVPTSPSPCTSPVKGSWSGEIRWGWPGLP